VWVLDEYSGNLLPPGMNDSNPKLPHPLFRICIGPLPARRASRF
jgi:hypothetical protein